MKLPARFYSGGKVYVDPKSYPDVDDAVIQFAYEIERNEIEIGEKIGEGEFCDVYKGRLLTVGNKHDVAVKMLKVKLFESLEYFMILDDPSYENFSIYNFNPFCTQNN